jgi:hypothetical protein
MRDKLTFDPNVPQTVTLQYQEGKLVDGRFGQQVMFSLEGNQVMYLDLGVAQKINMLEPAVGESFVICKRWNGQKGQPIRWDVWLSPETEKLRAVKEHPGGNYSSPRPGQPQQQFDPSGLYARKEAPPSELEQQLQASIEQIQRRNRGETLIQRRPPAAETAPIAAPQATGTNGPVAVPKPATTTTAAPAWAARLGNQTDLLIDVFAGCLEHANQHGNRVKPDDVRALLTTVYIAMTKNGASNAA